MSDAMKFEVNNYYNWKHQPERLIYRGKEGAWHQFSQVGSIAIWCEVLGEDLHMLEQSAPPEVQP